MKISIRKAIKSDMPTVFKMMNDLAETLGKGGLRTSLLDDLYKEGGFDGNHPVFFVLLAEDSETKDVNGLPTAIGFILCSHTFSWDGKGIYVRNFLINDSHRSKGVGKLLFESLMRNAKETGCNRIELHVHNTSTVKRFYEKMGAINVSEREGHVYYRLYKDVLDKFEA